LVAGAALTAHQLPALDEVNYGSRGFFAVSLVMSLLATFFTCLQQRTYGFLEDPAAIRAWLTNGQQYTTADGSEVFQSSTVSHQLLQVPFELLCISITTFLAGLGVYYGSALGNNLKLGSLAAGEDISIGNRGVLIAFVVSTAFALSLLGQLLGGKDIENRRCRKLTEAFHVSGKGLVLDEERRQSRELASPTSPIGKGSRKPFEDISIERGVAGSEVAGSFGKALSNAAAAHRACAAADAEVARWYEKMANK
jgi:hypothetical protein